MPVCSPITLAPTQSLSTCSDSTQAQGCTPQGLSGGNAWCRMNSCSSRFALHCCGSCSRGIRVAPHETCWSLGNWCRSHSKASLSESHATCFKVGMDRRSHSSAWSVELGSPLLSMFSSSSCGNEVAEAGGNWMHTSWLFNRMVNLTRFGKQRVYSRRVHCTSACAVLGCKSSRFTEPCLVPGFRVCCSASLPRRRPMDSW